MTWKECCTMRATTWLLTLLILIPAVTAFAQDEAPAEGEVPEVPPEIAERMARFQDMGMDEGEALFLSILTSGQLDTTQMLMLMMMAGEGNIDDDAFGFLMMMDAMKAQKQTGQPLVLERGDTLLIIDGGVLYKVDLEKMKLEGSVAYGEGARADAGAMLAILAPVSAKARQKAQQTSCLSNVKQICLGMLAYAQDYDEVFAARGLAWVDDVDPYIRNRQVLVCPSRPNLPVGYALNEKLIKAKLAQIHRPAETILVFESNLGGNNPVGGPAGVPEQGVHNGGINCGFVDGHAKWLRVEQARELLEQDPF